MAASSESSGTSPHTRLDEARQRSGRVFAAATMPFAAAHIAVGLITSSGWRITGAGVVVLAVLVLVAAAADARRVRLATWALVLVALGSASSGALLASGVPGG